MDVVSWRDEHRDNAFPFTVESSLLTDSGNIMAVGVLADVLIHVATDVSAVNLRSIELTAQLLTLVFGDASNVVGRCVIPTTDVQPDEVVPVLDGILQVGAVVLGKDCQSVLAWNLGLHSFNNTARLCVKTCKPIPPQTLSGIRLPSGEIVTGDVWLVGGNGVVIRSDPNQNLLFTPENPTTKVEVNIVGDPLFRQKLCFPAELFEAPRLLRTLRITNGDTTIDLDTSNGEPVILLSVVPDPGEYGNGVRISSTAKEIKFEVTGYA